MNSLTRFGKLLVCAVLIGCFGFLLLESDPSQANPQNPVRKPTPTKDKPRPDNAYHFSDPTPSGDWLGQPDIDILQSNNPDIPVVIAGIKSYVGKGNWRKQLMLESVVLKNRTFQAVSAVKFGWIIITEQDNNARKNRDAAMAHGFTQLVDVELPAQGMRREIPLYIDFVKEAKPLIKAGVLTGTFFLRARITEVHFEDGSVWTENDSIASSRRLSHVRSPPPQLPNCRNERCRFHENGQGYCETFFTSEGWICRRGAPCNPADPNACTCENTLCSQCKDEDNDVMSKRGGS